MTISETTETPLEQDARELLLSTLGNISCLETTPDGADSCDVDSPCGFSYGVRLHALGQLGEAETLAEWELRVIVKSHAYPRQLRSTIYESKLRSDRQLYRNRKTYTVYISPFISEQAAEICLEEGIGYLDLAGNCHLEFGSVYLHIAGQANRFKEIRPLKNLFAEKSARVLRVLLQGPLQGHKVADLAKKADVSLGLVSKIRNYLIDSELAIDTDAGICITKANKLLESWIDKDNFDDRTVTHDFALLEIDEQQITAKLSQLLQSEQIDYAFTQWVAANNRAAHTTPNIISCYVEKLPSAEALKQELGARESAFTTGRLRLIVSKDFKGVSIGRQEVKGLQQVSDLQTYLDLFGAGLRSDEQAEELIKLDDFNGGWSVDV